MSIDVKAITDFKIAIGAVERAACKRIQRFAAEVPADLAIVELGAYRGRTTGYLALGSAQGNGAHVYSVDPWETQAPLTDEYRAKAKLHETYHDASVREYYERHLIRCGIREYVTTIQATAVDAAASYKGPKVGLIFHDALHDAEHVEADLKAWMKHTAPGCVVVMHDAGNPLFGVEAGAEKVFKRRTTWDWNGRELERWKKNPNLRGTLTVRRK